jgi:hypothetical protein
VSRTGCKRGWQRDGHGRAMVGNNRQRRRSVGWTLQTREREIKGVVSVVMAGGCSSPFYSGRRGAHRTLMPLMAGRLDEGLRGD